MNPYFRSREQRALLEDAGIEVHGSTYREEITAEIPALGSSVRGPLENPNCRVIVDSGGNDSGALVLKQFGKYFTPERTDIIAVVNFSRFETRSVETALDQIRAIEDATGLRVTHIVNNTHLLRETTAQTVLSGNAKATALAQELGGDVRVLYDCYPARIVAPEDITALSRTAFPLNLYLRPTWLDR